MSRVARRAKLNVRQAFFVGYGVWLLPTLGRWATAGVSSRKVIYDSGWALVLYGLALAVIAVVYQRASSRGLSLVVSSTLSVVATLPVIALFYILDWWVTTQDPSLSCLPPGQVMTLQFALVTALTDAFGICLLLAAIVFLPVFARAHEERIRELDLVQRDAEILRIRAHLEPHFVLNSLNAVAGLVEEDPTQARELLAALGDLFRQASSFRATHRVADEIEWLRRYVTIHELRHPDVLRASWDVDDACLELECPALILQPLVENAVKHGALRGGGHLAVRARAAGGVLSFVVEDDGPELGGPRCGGQGLSIVQRRLELEDLPATAFELVREAKLTVARVRIPARVGTRHA